jgi:predicted transcriptional regulator
MEQIRAGVAEGLIEADAGELIEAGKVHAELRAKIGSVTNRRA